MLRSIVQDPWRKPLARIVWEAAGATIVNRALPQFYFRSLLFRRDVDDWRNYLSDRLERRIQASIKDTSRRPFLDNKILFHQYFRIPGVRLPRMLGYNVGPVAHVEGSNRLLGSAADLGVHIEELARRHGVCRLFVKPVGGIHGKDCFTIATDALEGPAIERLWETLCSGTFLFEELLSQHGELARIYPHSINTLRVVTYTDRSGAAHVVSTLLRLGANGKCIDNASAGGIFVKVDSRSGALGPFARKFFEFGGTVHFNHPDTGVAFAGRFVPDFERALEMALTAARHIRYRLVGWDIALTERGPVLIEGNHNPHLFGAEIADGGYRRNQVFAAFLVEAGLVGT